ncbi:AraC family transcriptional regulator [Cohnella candidum]|uniref:AraC family transcriptional regulator n=1 Tax=Cohnella candidum TaxID=2674991 RepID=A0A3G3K4G3_9BACL|nr:AraC family transcriptional regulator [Cohnella candidum]AYQ75290.1 AraC family transcriptional regulator [Cohnella candidum]
MTTTYFTILMKHLEQMQIEVASASETEVGAISVKPRDVVYDCNRFLYVRSGKGRLWALGKELELVPGTLCILLAGTPHRVAVDPGEVLNIQWCHFHASYGDRDIYRTLNLPISVWVENKSAVSQLFDRLIQELKKDQLTSRLRVKAIMLELVSMYLEELPKGIGKVYPTQELQKIDTVLQYIDEHMAENITVEELARQVYLHPNYFIVFFKAMLGYSPIQYVNHRRMETAKALLLQPECNVSDVAARVGMQIYYFSRMFKAHTGLTPSRYRKQSLGIAESGTDAEPGAGAEE